MKNKPGFGRNVFEVVPNGLSWHLLLPNGSVMFWPTQYSAVDAGRVRCSIIMRQGGLAQLIVHKKNGQFAYERTYGNDPANRKG